METEEKKTDVELTDREKVNLKNKLLIYLFFLLLSVLSWYLIALGKDHIATINYPVRYEKFPDGKVLVTDLPSEFKIEVKGQGFNILKHKFFTLLKPLQVPLSGVSIDTIFNNNHLEYILHTRVLNDIIARQLSYELQFQNIFPDTLHFVFTDVVSKKVPIVPVLNIEFEQQYFPNGKITIDPESIIVKGPQLIIDTLQFVYLKAVEKKNIKETFTKLVEIDQSRKLIYTKTNAWINIPVEKFTERTFSIPIIVENVPDDYKVKTFPSNIIVSCNVAVTDYNKINARMFVASINYDVLIKNEQRKIKVNLKKSPTKVRNVKFSPKSIEYLIEK